MISASQLTLEVQLPDDETFASYQGQINQPVVSLLSKFLAVNGAQSINGFYLFGVSGLGKSHLLHAACHYYHTQLLSSLCLSFSELQHLSVDVLDGLEHVDLICLDDIELVNQSQIWQQAIFDLYNRVLENNKKIIITGNHTVKALGLTLADLESRLAWGYVEQVKVLSDQEKILALQYRSQQRGLFIGDDVIRYFTSRISRNMNDLLSALDQLDKASIREQRKITIPFVKQVLNL